MLWKYPNIMADPENCFGWGTTHGERVEREPTTGFWGQRFRFCFFLQSVHYHY